MAARVVLQAVDSASLLVDNISRCVAIRQGVILYITFLSQATEATVADMTQTIISSKIFALDPNNDERSSSAVATSSTEESRRPKPISLAESTCDVLIIPQASLAGKIKGKVMQYHNQAPKDTGLQLYSSFCKQMRQALEPATAVVDENGWPSSSGDVVDGGDQLKGQRGGGEKLASRTRLVLNGTYGNRQGLQFASNGPFSHIIDF